MQRIDPRYLYNVARYAVSDLDNHAVGFVKTKPDEFLSPQAPCFLSPVYLDFLRNGGYNEDNVPYDGFYVCTHRCFMTAAQSAAQCQGSELYKTLQATFRQGFAEQKEEISFQNYVKKCFEKMFSSKQESETTYRNFCTFGDMADIDPEDYYTTRIIANIEKFANVPFVKASTPDDEGYECGSGYENILKPYEEKELIPYVNLKEFKCESLSQEQHEMIKTRFQEKIEEVSEIDFSEYPQKPVLDFNPKTKNPQLIQVCDDASERHEDGIVILDFSDDLEAVRESAKKLDPARVSANVILRVHKHVASIQSPVTLETIIEGTKQTRNLVKQTVHNYLAKRNVNLNVIGMEEIDELIDTLWYVIDLYKNVSARRLMEILWQHVKIETVTQKYCCGLFKVQTPQMEYTKHELLSAFLPQKQRMPVVHELKLV